MVDGKEFFGGDVKTGLKNLPVEMIDKLKTYDKQSDLARITGIDDGEEETVLDLTVKKGMNRGWFGNADAAVGTEDRYAGRMNLSHFVDKTQITLIGSANNVNNQGFSGGGGGPRWRRNNGLNAPKELGISFATENKKIELGGSAQYNHNNADIINIYLLFGGTYKICFKRNMPLFCFLLLLVYDDICNRVSCPVYKVQSAYCCLHFPNIIVQFLPVLSRSSSDNCHYTF